MRILVDTNVWLDVVLPRTGQADAAAFLLRCCARGDELWTAWHSLSNIDYILARAKQTAAQRGQHLRDLPSQSRVAATNEQDALFALGLGRPDFEDALQYAAAHRVQANVIVTGNTRDFASSSIPALTTTDFLARHL